MQDELNDYFLAIIEYGSITKAAEKLYLSQPSLSKHIKHLEIELGIVLIDRTSRPIRLTPAGERYASYLKEVSNLNKQLKKELMEIGSDIRGRVVVGIANWRASLVIPMTLPQFWNKYPGIRVELREGSHQRITNLLLQGEVDFCIMNTTADFPYTVTEPLFDEFIYICVNKNSNIYKRAAKEFGEEYDAEIPIEWATDEEFILLKHGQNLREFTDRYMSDHNIRPNCIFETENLTTAMGLINAGVGVTFVPACGRHYQWQMKNLHFFKIGSPPLAWKLSIVRRSNSYECAQERKLIDHIRDTVVL